MEFEREEAEDLTDRPRHGLALAEAPRQFESGDENLELFDADHSKSEDRFIAIEPIARGLIYLEPQGGTTRIISARTTTAREQSLFREHMDGVR